MKRYTTARSFGNGAGSGSSPEVIVCLKYFYCFRFCLESCHMENGMQYFRRKEKRLLSHSLCFLRTVIHRYTSFMLSSVSISYSNLSLFRLQMNWKHRADVYLQTYHGVKDSRAGARLQVLSTKCLLHLPSKKSQNHRIMAAGRNLWRPTGPTSCSKQAQLKQVGFRPCPVVFWVS